MFGFQGHSPPLLFSSSITGHSFSVPFADSSYPQSLKDGETQGPRAFLLHTHPHDNPMQLICCRLLYLQIL